MPEAKDQRFELEVQQSLVRSRSVKQQAELTAQCSGWTFSSKNFSWVSKENLCHLMRAEQQLTHLQSAKSKHCVVRKYTGADTEVCIITNTLMETPK